MGDPSLSPWIELHLVACSACNLPRPDYTARAFPEVRRRSSSPTAAMPSSVLASGTAHLAHDWNNRSWRGQANIQFIPGGIPVVCHRRTISQLVISPRRESLLSGGHLWTRMFKCLKSLHFLLQRAVLVSCMVYQFFCGCIVSSC